MGIDSNGDGSAKHNARFDFQNQASTTSGSTGLMDVPQGRTLDARLNVRPPDLREFDVEPSSGFRPRRRSRRRVADRCPDR